MISTCTLNQSFDTIYIFFFFFFWSKEKEKLAMSDGRREVELKEKKETVTWNHWIIFSMIHAIL